jgi:adenylosuccinate lyase
MIPRYSRPEMTAIWEPEVRYQIWLDIETFACEALAEHGVIPAEVPLVLKRDGKFDVQRIEEIEKTVKHDVIAFLTNLAESIGDSSRFVHRGLTSSDVLDTCLAVQLVRASDILLADIDVLLEALEEKAQEHKYTPCIGRSHGMHAEPTTFGLKMASAFAEFRRNRKRLEDARSDVAVCAISGAVGTYENVPSYVEEHVASQLGLNVEEISTQVIPRDRHAHFFATLGIIASSIERLAVEIRHLQRTEVQEVEEPFTLGQKGSSAMPHKRNPILTENLTGLARLVRSYAFPAMENVALWHERDISHSSVERVIGPDATIALDFSLSRMATVIKTMTVNAARMKDNLERLNGIIHSEAVLLTLTQQGALREDAYLWVQRCAVAALNSDHGQFAANLKKDSDIRRFLDDTKIDRLCSDAPASKEVDVIFERVFKGHSVERLALHKRAAE